MTEEKKIMLDAVYDDFNDWLSDCPVIWSWSKNKNKNIETVDFDFSEYKNESEE